jgi:hypothetical protein
MQPTISLEMPVPSQGHYGFHSFPVVYNTRPSNSTKPMTFEMIFLCKLIIAVSRIVHADFHLYE